MTLSLALWLFLAVLGVIILYLVVVSNLGRNTRHRPVDFSKFAKGQPQPQFVRGVNYIGHENGGNKRNYYPGKASKRGPSIIFDAMDAIDAVTPDAATNPSPNSSFMIDPKIEERVLRGNRYSFANLQSLQNASHNIDRVELGLMEIRG